jgi:hypothetical protein
MGSGRSGISLIGPRRFWMRSRLLETVDEGKSGEKGSPSATGRRLKGSYESFCSFRSSGTCLQYIC